MTNYYPGWIMRLYTDYDVEDPVFSKICDLACYDKYSHLDICHVKKLPGTPFSDGSKIFGMNWRFFQHWIHKYALRIKNFKIFIKNFLSKN